LHCTYIDIPQVEHTCSVVLSKPFWMWGAEIGVNEHGLVIGNEAVFSKVPAPQDPALIGMDLLRLGLERAATAPQAVEIITALLESLARAIVASCATYYQLILIVGAGSLGTRDGRRRWQRRVKGAASISNCPDPWQPTDRASAVSFT
jgi:hypothetical protein